MLIAMKNRLAELITKHGLKHWSFGARKDPEFMSWVMSETSEMPDDTLFPVRVYAATSGTRPQCEHGGMRTLKSIQDGWKFCGKAGICQCAKKSVSDSMKAACANRSADDIAKSVAKREKTFVERHGITNAGRLPQALAAHAGFYADPKKVAIAVQKGAETMLELYGVANALQLEKVVEIRRYNSTHRTEAQKESATAKRRAHAANGGFLASSHKRLVAKFDGLGFTMLTTEEEYFGVGGTGKRYKYKFSCHRCNLRFVDYIYDGADPSCPICDYKEPKGTSKPEIEIAGYVRSLGVLVIQNTHSLIQNMEIDIQAPDHKVAVEHGGLWWHCEGSHGKKKWYHFMKLKKCADIGYRLVTIFGDEWLEKKDICKRRLAHIFGVETERVFARKTTIVTITAAEAREFLERNHIQGYAQGATEHLGLMNGNVLVSVMTFGKPRMIQNQPPPGPRDWELSRFASSVLVVGGASKLFAAFVRAYDPWMILSFCDKRWGTGKVYDKMGFALEGESAPGYFWVEKYLVRHDRSKFTKYKLVEQGFDANISESEIMFERGFDRIWDCGNLRYRWHKPT